MTAYPFWLKPYKKCKRKEGGSTEETPKEIVISISIPREPVEQLKEIAEEHGWKFLLGGLILLAMR